MFPSVEVVMTGLEPSHIYSVLISVELTDSCRYRYNEEHGWLTITTGAQASIPPRMVPHRHSRNTGSHFMRNRHSRFCMEGKFKISNAYSYIYTLWE